MHHQSLKENVISSLLSSAIISGCDLSVSDDECSDDESLRQVGVSTSFSGVGVGSAAARAGASMAWDDVALRTELAVASLARPRLVNSASLNNLSQHACAPPAERALPRRSFTGIRPPTGLLGKSSAKKAVEIVHVSNDDEQHMVLKKFLRAHSFDVKHANGAERLLDMLQCRNSLCGVEAFPDIVLMESELQGMSCVEAIKVTRLLYPQAPMPVIVVGDANMPETEVCLALQAGAVDYMCNPITRQALLARIGVQLNLQNFWHAKVEAAQNEHLLQKILPHNVIERLKDGQTCISDELDEVSILFSDIKGFTNLAASINTVQLIDLLDSLFGTFDTLTDKHGVYKVETIGDAYMVVSGHDNESREDHMLRLMAMAQDMLRAAHDLPMPGDGHLQIRIGIHTGPAYAGVVGRKCPRYCLFGETVTVANKMESSGYPQTIHCTESSRRCYLARGGDMGFESLGMCNPTGKEVMETYVARVWDWEEAVHARLECSIEGSSDSDSSVNSISPADSPVSPLLLRECCIPE